MHSAARLLRAPGAQWAGRFFASGVEAKTSTLQASAGVNTGKLAGAITARLRSGSGCIVDGIGPSATYSALKAIKIAGDYVNEEFNGKVLAIHPVMAKLPERLAPSGRTSATMLQRLRVAAVMPVEDKEPQELVYISADTNPGIAAGLMSRTLEAKGVLPVACMGAEPTSKAIKAIMITEDYMRKNGTLNAQVLTFTVTKDWFKEGTEDRSRLLLRCSPLPASELPE